MALTDEQKRSLRMANIPSKYHGTTLGSLGPVGQKLKDMIVNGEVDDALSQDIGFTFVGEGYRNRAVFMAFARALHLRGVPVYVTNIVGLMELMDDPGPLEDRQILFVDRFMPEEGTGFPFTASDRYRLITFLLDWVDDVGHIMPMTSSNDRDAIYNWWGKDLSDVVLDRNEVHTIKGRT